MPTGPELIRHSHDRREITELFDLHGRQAEVAGVESPNPGVNAAPKGRVPLHCGFAKPPHMVAEIVVHDYVRRLAEAQRHGKQLFEGVEATTWSRRIRTAIDAGLIVGPDAMTSEVRWPDVPGPL